MHPPKDPPVPPDPPDPPQSALLLRRRKSLPLRAHRANPSSIDTSSPEVISSLISSLSTISAPLQSHFENVPHIGSDSGPPSPESLIPPPSPLDRVRSDHGSGLTDGADKIAEEPPHSPFLHPDDAAASPVIRMARAPPSPKSAPKSKSPTPAESSRPVSRGSYTSAKAAYEDSAFGMITAEPALPRASTTSVASSSSGRPKSIKGQLGLLKKPSREFPSSKQRQAERLRKTSSYNDSLRHNMPRNGLSLRSMHSMADLAEEGRPTTVAMESQENSAPPTRQRNSSQSVREKSINPPGIGSGRAIPVRESSLRHSFSSSSKKRRSARHSRYSSTGSKDMKNDSGSGAGNEAEQVTKRIQELKDQQQKIKTELETDNSPGKSVTPEPPKQVARPQTPTKSVENRSTTNVNGVNGDTEESAPSPAVMTGKSSTKARSQAARPSLERPSRSESRRQRRSVEPSTPTGHRRRPSAQFSPDHESIVDERRLSVDSIDLAVLDYVASPKLTQKVCHPTTGRVIAFSEVGDPKGHVVLCCLGMGLTRYLMAFYDELARTLKLRLITLDRPGIGESGSYMDESGPPLNWPDDVAVVCNHLKVTKFSILAHSAGAIYALATALRIPQHIRGRLHLLAPWIPPSQLSSIGSQKAPVPTNAVPYSQRILRALPTPLLKVANSSFLNTTSASITSNLPKSSRRKRKGTTKESSAGATADDGSRRYESKAQQQLGIDSKTFQSLETPALSTVNDKSELAKDEATITASQDQERQTEYDTRLTHKIWELATTNANPAVDLLTCLERRQNIGFRYVDITRAVVIHHGSRDTRVPVDNVRWLGKTMRRCEVRILEGESHGLMASAAVMGNVLMEIAKEWEDWMIVVQGKGKRRATINHGAQTGIPVQS